MITGSERVMKTARAWITRCATSDTECKEKNHFVPTRLLHITNNGTQANVIDASQYRYHGYIALSHTWGGGISYRLMRENYETLAENIKVSELPQNFQDAIAITVKLNFSHIWIDSLCIIQDSVEDWKKEAVTMGDVYANAACTISATASQDSTGGCFRKRDSFLHTDCVLLYSKSSCLYISPTIKEQEMSLEDAFYKRVDLAPLSQRGWIFQEKLLSRRILHFCDGIVLFECNTMRASEFEPYGKPYERKEYIRRDGKIYNWDELKFLNSQPLGKFPRYGWHFGGVG